jgi:hypothetical protein
MQWRAVKNKVYLTKQRANKWHHLLLAAICGDTWLGIKKGITQTVISISTNNQKKDYGTCKLLLYKLIEGRVRDQSLTTAFCNCHRTAVSSYSK